MSDEQDIQNDIISLRDEWTTRYADLSLLTEAVADTLLVQRASEVMREKLRQSRTYKNRGGW